MAATITTELLDDRYDESEETFQMTMSDPVNATLATPSATGTIIDNDSAPALSIEGDSAVEGGTLEFEVRLEPASEGSVAVHYETRDHTATEGRDYRAAAGTLSFAAGDVSAVIPVRLLDDLEDESDERVDLVLSSPTGAELVSGVRQRRDRGQRRTTAAVRGRRKRNRGWRTTRLRGCR